jgi:hypothetical protein
MMWPERDFSLAFGSAANAAAALRGQQIGWAIDIAIASSFVSMLYFGLAYAIAQNEEIRARLWAADETLSELRWKLIPGKGS